MKFVLACYGTRGDVEPWAAVGRELLRSGHDVRMAVPPDLVGFAESAGLAAVAYGLETQAWLDVYRNFWTCFSATSGGFGICAGCGAKFGSPLPSAGRR